jgi:hypothetical protein
MRHFQGHGIWGSVSDNSADALSIRVWRSSLVSFPKQTIPQMRTYPQQLLTL